MDEPLTFSKWQTCSLGDIVLEQGIQTGPFGSQLHAADYTSFGVPVVMPKDMVNQRISSHSIARIPSELAGSLNRHMLSAGDIVFSRRGEIGRCALVTAVQAGWLCGTGSLRVRLSPEKALPEYVIHAVSLQESIGWLVTNSVGQTMLNLSATTLSQLPLKLPSLSVQHKISQILDTWDSAIAQVEQLIAALQRRKQGLMQRLLTGQVRFPEFEGEQWHQLRLGEFLTYSPRKVEKPAGSYVRMGIRSHGKGTFTEIIDDPSSNAMDFLYEVKGDDLIVNITFAWEQAIAIVDPKDAGALVSHRFPTYEFDRTKVVSEFFRYLMLTERFHDQLELITPGGAGRNRVMSKTDFLKLVVNVPTVPEQQRIGQVLLLCDAEISTYRRYRVQLQAQKKGLMQRLLTGQVRVKVQEHVPTS